MSYGGMCIHHHHHNRRYDFAGYVRISLHQGDAVNAKIRMKMVGNYYRHFMSDLKYEVAALRVTRGGDGGDAIVRDVASPVVLVEGWWHQNEQEVVMRGQQFGIASLCTFTVPQTCYCDVKIRLWGRTTPLLGYVVDWVGAFIENK